MEEQKEDKVQEATPTTPPPEDDPLARAESVIKSLKEQNDRFEKNLRDHKEIMAKQMLSGKSSINPGQDVSEEQKKKTEALEFWKGTDIAKSIEKHG